MQSVLQFLGGFAAWLLIVLGIMTVLADVISEGYKACQARVLTRFIF
jgi:hypothetical protein